MYAPLVSINPELQKPAVRLIVITGGQGLLNAVPGFLGMVKCIIGIKNHVQHMGPGCAAEIGRYFPVRPDFLNRNLLPRIVPEHMSPGVQVMIGRH